MLITKNSRDKFATNLCSHSFRTLIRVECDSKLFIATSSWPGAGAGTGTRCMETQGKGFVHGAPTACTALIPAGSAKALTAMLAANSVMAASSAGTRGEGAAASIY